MVPAPLLHSSAPVLEFATLRELLRAYAQSDLGRARLDALGPSTDQAWIAHQQRLTAQVREFMRAGANFDFSGLTAVTRLVEKSRIAGAALEALDIRDVIALVDRAAEWRQLALDPPTGLEGGFTDVAGLSSAIIDFTQFLRAFRNKIQPDGTLDDRASPELARLRSEVEKQKRLIQESLRHFAKRLAEDAVVQEELVTFRGERFVIPVKTEQRRRVNGVVHGMSSSGQTVFMEPLETIEQNNELVRMLEEEQAEVRRILLEMTRRIGEHADAILAAQDALAELELQFAKARYALDYGCTQPQIGAAGISLRNARHPLLERNLRGKRGRVVPLSVQLREQRQLIISGPNTGGKTVALKTVGLLALMAQAGVPVPAEAAALPVFDALLADIGDYQSIEANLSTFSSHITNIDFISRTATRDSLVLLDELGSATDPHEGAVLAVSIAEFFRRAGAFSVISTHHTALKIYATNTEGVLNAAVGFDEKTLQPTYELKVGIPGASAGINIAQRLGLNPEIISAARSRLGSESQDITRFLDQLHAELRDVAADRARLLAAEQQIARERERLEREGMKEQRAKVREMEKKLEATLRDLEYQMREAVAAVQDRAAAQKLSKEAERRIARLRREFKEQFDAALVAHRTGADQGDPHARPGEVKYVSQGDTVRLKSLGKAGTVTRKIDEETFEVQIGPMKTRVPRGDIAEVLNRPAAESKATTPIQAARSRGIAVTLQDENLSAASEINVIGKTVDDATREVEKFVDRAFLAGMPRVRIVHGSGMGILRKALREFLKQHPHVATVSEPPQNEGGAGATVAELRT